MRLVAGAATNGRQRVLSPLQERSAGVKDLRGPNALAIAHVTKQSGSDRLRPAPYAGETV